MRIGVLASHEGTTLQAVMDACGAGAIDACVAIVISNNSGSGALRRARAASIRAVHLSGTTHPASGARDVAIRDALTAADIDLVLLAGYLKRIGPKTLARFSGRVINTHPAPLPRFGGVGMHGLLVHRAVLDAGVRASEVCIHAVGSDYDDGPVLARAKVDVHPGDTPASLAERVQRAERALLISFLDERASDEAHRDVD